jgi:hypothetical protein
MSGAITHAEDVAKFLRENVVQGEAADTEGKYSMLELVNAPVVVHSLMQYARAPNP